SGLEVDPLGEKLQSQSVVHRFGRLAETHAVVKKVSKDLYGQRPVPGIDAGEVADDARIEHREADGVIRRDQPAVLNAVLSGREPATRRAVVARAVYKHGGRKVDLPVTQVVGPEAACHFIGIAVREEEQGVLSLAS